MNFHSYFAIEKKMKAQGFDFERKELILQFTNENKEGLSTLTPHEYREFINWLNQRFPSTPAPKKLSSLENQRRKIISIFRQMGYETPENKADMKRIYAWVLKSGYLHKGFNQYTDAEIPKLVYQAEQVLMSYLKSI